MISMMPSDKESGVYLSWSSMVRPPLLVLQASRLDLPL